MEIKKEVFMKVDDNSQAYLFTIRNSAGMRIAVSNYGALLVSVELAVGDGCYVDAVLGYDNPEEYLVNDPLFGATVGRVINRIENASFVIDGITYSLVKNRGNHNIHTDKEKGFHKVLWDYEIIDEGSICFKYKSPDLETGFPGNLNMSVTYTLTEGNEIIISYRGISDKKTVINPSNHSYFNLDRDKSKKLSILDHYVMINADAYTPVNDEVIPLGTIKSVCDSSFDLRALKKIRESMSSPCLQNEIAKGGYDHNFVLNNPDIGIRRVAQISNGSRDIFMNVYTDLPGLQFYTSNSLKSCIGRNKAEYGQYSGICLEPQFFPNNINTSGFKKSVFDAGEEYRSTTIYEFIAL